MDNITSSSSSGNLPLVSLDYASLFEQRLPDIQWNGSEGTARCPFHNDHSPSLSVNRESGLFHCFACDASGNAQQFAHRMGVPVDVGNGTRFHFGLTLQRYANEKGLNVDFLKSVGLKDATRVGKSGKAFPYVEIPYYDNAGSEVAVRKRIVLAGGKQRVISRKGEKQHVYGDWRLAPQSPYAILVEGESDCHTLWQHDFPAIGIPGASFANDKRLACLDTIPLIYVVNEGDSGGKTLIKWVTGSRFRDRIRILTFGEYKDPSALYLADPALFRERLQERLNEAMSWGLEPVVAPKGKTHMHLTMDCLYVAHVTIPTIVTNNRSLPEISGETLEALQATNDPPEIFVRSGQLVRRVHDEYGRPVINKLSPEGLRGAIARSADFIQKRPVKDKWIEAQTSPPIEVVQDILSLGQWPLPALTGLTQCPVLRPDGTIHSNPGYDRVTGLLYDPTPGLAVPPMPSFPTEADARNAATFLATELLSDFPFRDSPDLANMVATLLTPIVRPAITGCIPMPLIDKNSPGTGAGLLTDLVAIIATGDHAQRYAFPEGQNVEQEVRKQITALLMDGSPVAILDNIEERLQSTCLNVLLTTSTWKDRILGASQTITLPNRVMLIATGNNIAVRGDIARRVFRVRMDAKEEKPWERTEFRHKNLLAWTRAHRGELLAALLTMARAWFVAEEPETEGPRLGGFEEWARIVGGILAYGGIPGFLLNQEDVYESIDDEGPQWGTFLQKLYVFINGKPFTVSEVVSPINHDTEMFKALPDSVGWDNLKPDSSRIRLGKAFQKRDSRIYSGFKLVKDKGTVSHQHSSKWKVVKI